MSFSRLREARRVQETARRRRAHLCMRASLALAMRLAVGLVVRAYRLRRALDPSGGAEDPSLVVRG